MYLVALLLYGSSIELKEELPELVRRARAIAEQAQQFWVDHVPAWLTGPGEHPVPMRLEETERLRDLVSVVINGAAVSLGEALVVGLYLVFLLLEAEQFPARVRQAYPDARAERVLNVAATINASLAEYLKVTINISLLLAGMVTVVLWLFGVKFALMWGLLTFIANFVPYVGSIVACSLPIVFSFLQLDLGWRPVAVAILLVACHTFTAYVIQPGMTGRAVGLSPLVVMTALAFWGLCWGLIGMVLAVPLTVMLKIIMENIPATRALARLLAEQ
jgi:AI-2 transport protein TqsA